MMTELYKELLTLVKYIIKNLFVLLRFIPIVIKFILNIIIYEGNNIFLFSFTYIYITLKMNSSNPSFHCVIHILFILLFNYFYVYF